MVSRRMMRLCTEPKNRYVAITAFDREVLKSYPELSALLLRRIGPSGALLLAEPRADAENLGWYTQATGRPVRVASLHGPAGDAIAERCRDLCAQVRQLAEALTQDRSDPRNRYLGILLGAALEVPSPAHVWALDDQPVLTFWGFRGEPPFDLSSISPAPPPAAWRPSRLSVVLGVLALAALFATGGWLWMRACCQSAQSTTVVQRMEVAPDQVEEPAVSVPSPDQVKEPAAPAPEPPPHAPTVPAVTQTAPTLPADDHSNDNSKSPPEATKVAPPPPARVVPRKDREANGLMHIPADRDLTQLEGCWRTEPYRYSSGRALGISTYCFGPGGHGQMTHSEGVVCSAPAHVELQGPSAMRLVDHDTICSDGSFWQQDELRCTATADGVANCAGASGRFRWNVRLHRVPRH
jgi:hypothetical protein